MAPDLWMLYRQMLRSRRFEEAVYDLWQRGLISGEMHLGLGEEAVVAGITAHLQEGDALALDHRGTPPMVMRGIDLTALLKELLGHEEGLCGGMGGHMHLLWPEALAASSGIVGAAGPAAAGFAMAGQRLRPGTVAVAYFGEAAMNQGMLMESLNLASAWQLPVLFVCKANDWAITTVSSSVTGGSLLDRAASFDMLVETVDGTNVADVALTAEHLLSELRDGHGPAFLLAQCAHLEGHFLGDQLLGTARNLLTFTPHVGKVTTALTALRGASMPNRFRNLGQILSLLNMQRRELSQKGRDPVENCRRMLTDDPARLKALEQEVTQEIKLAVQQAMTVQPETR